MAPRHCRRRGFPGRSPWGLEDPGTNHNAAAQVGLEEFGRMLEFAFLEEEVRGRDDQARLDAAARE